jgi:hypothetical protein
MVGTPPEPARMRRIRPGLYERIDTPRRVAISGRLLDAIRAERPWLADWLEASEQRLAELSSRPWWRRIWS